MPKNKDLETGLSQKQDVNNQSIHIFSKGKDKSTYLELVRINLGLQSMMIEIIFSCVSPCDMQKYQSATKRGKIKLI